MGRGHGGHTLQGLIFGSLVLQNQGMEKDKGSQRQSDHAEYESVLLFTAGNTSRVAEQSQLASSVKTPGCRSGGGADITVKGLRVKS